MAILESIKEGMFAAVVQKIETMACYNIRHEVISIWEAKVDSFVSALLLLKTFEWSGAAISSYLVQQPSYVCPNSITFMIFAQFLRKCCTLIILC